MPRLRRIIWRGASSVPRRCSFQRRVRRIGILSTIRSMSRSASRSSDGLIRSNARPRNRSPALHAVSDGMVSSGASSPASREAVSRTMPVVIAAASSGSDSGDGRGGAPSSSRSLASCGRSGRCRRPGRARTARTRARRARSRRADARTGPRRPPGPPPGRRCPPGPGRARSRAPRRGRPSGPDALQLPPEPQHAAQERRARDGRRRHPQVARGIQPASVAVHRPGPRRDTRPPGRRGRRARPPGT